MHAVSVCCQTVKFNEYTEFEWPIKSSSEEAWQHCPGYQIFQGGIMDSNKQGWFAVTLSLQIKADLTVEQQQQKEWPTWLYRWQPAVTHYKEEVRFMTSKVRGKLSREDTSLNQWWDNLETNFHQRNVLGSVKVSRKHLWHNVVDCHNKSFQLIPHFPQKMETQWKGMGSIFGGFKTRNVMLIHL